MINRLSRLKGIAWGSLLAPFSTGHDSANPNTETSKKIAEETKDETQTGLDRLYLMFSTDEFGQPSHEVVNVWHIMMMSMMIGAGIGGFVRSRVSFLDFTERNDATSFTSHLEAKQKLQDKVTMGFARGAWQWGWRLTAFTGCYATTSTAISVYRGKHGIMEHIVAGALTGAMYKVNLGVRGVVVGGTLGSFLGVLGGISIWGIMKLTGVTMDDMKKTTHTVHSSRQKAFQGHIDAYLAQKEPPILHDHDAKIGETHLNLNTITTEENSRPA